MKTVALSLALLATTANAEIEVYTSAVLCGSAEEMITSIAGEFLQEPMVYSPGDILTPDGDTLPGIVTMWVNVEGAGWTITFAPYKNEETLCVISSSNDESGFKSIKEKKSI